MTVLIHYIQKNGIAEWGGIAFLVAMVTVFPGFCYGVKTWAMRSKDK